jgi:ComF family protein
MSLRKILARFPQSCALCGMTADERFCRRCIDILPWNDCSCERCGQPLLQRLSAAVVCAKCQQHPPLFSRACAPLRYEFPVDTALRKLKFRRQLVFAPAFAALMAPIITAKFSACDSLVPVPLHRWRHATRGFNQADELCRTLGRQCSLPVLMNVIRTRATSPQSGLSAAARRSNLHDAFRVRGQWSSNFPLIIDDVMTTGTTCDALAKTLLEAGASQVGVLAVARA